MLALLAAIVIIAGGLLRVMQNNNSMSLSDYERLNTSQTPTESSEEITESQNGTENAENAKLKSSEKLLPLHRQKKHCFRNLPGCI